MLSEKRDIAARTAEKYRIAARYFDELTSNKAQGSPHF